VVGAGDSRHDVLEAISQLRMVADDLLLPDVGQKHDRPPVGVIDFSQSTALGHVSRLMSRKVV
jgi:hypothetical protein